MTTTQTPQQAADSIVELLGSLAKPNPGAEPVDKMSVYWSASARNRKGGWIANTTRGCLVQHIELRAATDQESAEAEAAKLFYVREVAA